eukprot:CAMPEP_0179421530 /NCGR_PEP_ID=MMETSP0799-20121207/9839_1 /TAXON_ID=46947 /ORGANISM="Geminigera cryophila, Strain CCMP2564" /LENGTH=137 /DNA_ID=CAMNT_0021195391 /DNA_START=204 /DNA_END=614 /DNA_ORIENTATION=+
MTQTRVGLGTVASHHGGRVLRKTVSSPGAAAAVQELVGKGVQSVQVELSANERSELSVTVEAPHRPFNHSEDCPSSHSALSQDATPLSYVAAAEDKRFFQQRTPVPDSPVYSALQQELTNLKLKGQESDAAGWGESG